MADVGADPALIYAFQKTGIYVCEENEPRLTMRQLAAWSGAVDEYHYASAPVTHGFPVTETHYIEIEFAQLPQAQFANSFDRSRFTSSGALRRSAGRDDLITASFRPPQSFLPLNREPSHSRTTRGRPGA
jgi:hypothetical protein